MKNFVPPKIYRGTVFYFPCGYEKWIANLSLKKSLAERTFVANGVRVKVVKLLVK